MSTFKCKSGAQKRKEKTKRKEIISKYVKISEFFTSEERGSSKFGNLMIDGNIVMEKQQPSTSSQNQTETTTDDLNSDIISTNEVRTNYIFIFFSILFAT